MDWRRVEEILEVIVLQLCVCGCFVTAQLLLLTAVYIVYTHISSAAI